ncbi:MAG: geranylgeranylglyceryl/heptaprenylglyceryl phosphate synthase, partial [Fluviicola sp.]
VSYISQTTPIPRNQLSIIRKTVLAGEQIGHRICFLDAGSGAITPISKEIIETVRKTISNPLIVGGGIRSIDDIKTAFENGANLVVSGNQIEENIDFLLDIHSFQSQFNR